MTALHTATGPELTASELYALLRLRVDVFVVEQECPYPELDGHDLDPDTVHLWWQPEDSAEPLACLRILAGEAAHSGHATTVPGAVRIGRVCTAKAARGTGLGGILMTAAMAHIGDVDSVLDAQVQAQGLYARFGYTPIGDEFDEDGIPHITMHRPARG